MICVGQLVGTYVGASVMGPSEGPDVVEPTVVGIPAGEYVGHGGNPGGVLGKLGI